MQDKTVKYGNLRIDDVNENSLKFGGMWYPLSDSCKPFFKKITLDKTKTYRIGTFNGQVVYISEETNKFKQKLIPATSDEKTSSSISPRTEKSVSTQEDYWREKFQLEKKKHDEIRREAVLNSAIEYAKIRTEDDGTVFEVKKIIEIAQLFEKYVLSE